MSFEVPGGEEKALGDQGCKLLPTCLSLGLSLPRPYLRPRFPQFSMIESCFLCPSEGSAEKEVAGPKEPLEQLKAELEALRLLVTDANKHGGRYRWLDPWERKWAENSRGFP